jgi:hypothetical protein
LLAVRSSSNPLCTTADHAKQKGRGRSEVRPLQAARNHDCEEDGDRPDELNVVAYASAHGDPQKYSAGEYPLASAPAYLADAAALLAAAGVRWLKPQMYAATADTCSEVS